MAEDEAIALFLHATKAGLFEMEWHLVCGSCGHLVESLKSMAHLHAHYVCDSCNAENEADLDNYIQVAFTILPQLREIAFHQPDSLSVEDLYFKYHLCKSVGPVLDGQKLIDLLTDFTRHLSYLEPGEKKTLELNLSQGQMRISDLITGALLLLFISDQLSPEKQALPLKLVAGKFEMADRPLFPLTTTTDYFTFKIKQTDQLPGGKAILEVENLMDKKGSVWIMQFPPDFAPAPIEYEAFLSGKRLLSHQTFRDLYRFEVIKSAEGIAVKDLTYLFTDLKGSTELYDLIGDPQAFYLVMQHFDTLVRVVAAHSGAIVKTIGDAIMATFITPVEAVAAAIDMLREIEAFNRGISQQLILKIGIHKGHSIAVTLNDRLDYFGQTVNIASRVQGLAGANEIYISRDIHDYPGVTAVLAECDTASERVVVKGVSETIEVYKVTIQS